MIKSFVQQGMVGFHSWIVFWQSSLLIFCRYQTFSNADSCSIRAARVRNDSITLKPRFGMQLILFSNGIHFWRQPRHYMNPSMVMAGLRSVTAWFCLSTLDVDQYGVMISNKEVTLCDLKLFPCVLWTVRYWNPWLCSTDFKENMRRHPFLNSITLKSFPRFLPVARQERLWRFKANRTLDYLHFHHFFHDPFNYNSPQADYIPRYIPSANSIHTFETSTQSRRVALL